MDNEATGLSGFQTVQSELASSNLSSMFHERPTSTDFVDRNDHHLFH